MLDYTGIPYEDLLIRNIPIDQEGNYIRTTEVGDKQK
jgi:hypothetical protein